VKPHNHPGVNAAQLWAGEQAGEQAEQSISGVVRWMEGLLVGFTSDRCVTDKGMQLPEYGQSFVMLLISCKGMSAVRYGLVPVGIGGRPVESAVTSPNPMSPFSAVTTGLTGGDRRDGNLERVSALPH